MSAPGFRQSRGRIWLFDSGGTRVSSAHGAAVTRRLLAGHLGVSPREVHFERSPCGKPFLPKSISPKDDIRFSISHSGQYLAVAIAYGRECGVDIELLNRRVDSDKVVPVCCSDDEGRALREIADPAVRQSVFLRLWTLKEAATKTLGLGFAFPFREADFASVVPALRRGETVSSRRTLGEREMVCRSLAVHSALTVAYCVERKPLAPASRKKIYRVPRA